MITWYDLKPDTDYDDSFFTQEVGGVSYSFRTTYNLRSAQWILSVSDMSGNLLAAAPLLVGTDIFQIYRELGLFTPIVFLVANDGVNTECARDDLNTRCSLLVGVVS